MENWQHFLVTLEERAVADTADVAAERLSGVANYQDSSPDRTSNAYRRIDWMEVAKTARHNSLHDNTAERVDSVDKPTRRTRRRRRGTLAAFRGCQMSGRPVVSDRWNKPAAIGRQRKMDFPCSTNLAAIAQRTLP